MSKGPPKRAFFILKLPDRGPVQLVVNLRRAFAITWVFLLLQGCVLAPSPEVELTTLKPGQYRLDPDHASLLFKVSHLQLSTYVGRFNEFDASLDFNPENMTATRLEAIVNTNSVDVNNDGLERTLSKPDWFDSGRYPQARFVTTAVRPLDNNSFEFSGDLTIRNVTRKVTLNGTFHGGATNILTGKYTLGFSAIGVISRASFGIDSYAKLVGDEVNLEVYAEFQRL